MIVKFQGVSPRVTLGIFAALGGLGEALLYEFQTFGIKERTEGVRPDAHSQFHRGLLKD